MLPEFPVVWLGVLKRLHETVPAIFGGHVGGHLHNVGMGLHNVGMGFLPSSWVGELDVRRPDSSTPRIDWRLSFLWPPLGICWLGGGRLDIFSYVAGVWDQHDMNVFQL